MALGSSEPGPAGRHAHHRNVDHHDPLRGLAGWSFRVRGLTVCKQLPGSYRSTCYTRASGDADYLGSGCPNGRALDDFDTATEPGRFGDSRTGDYTGTNGIPGANCLFGALGDAERDTGAKLDANSLGRAVAQRDCGTHSLTNAYTRAIADGETKANSATVGRANAIAVTARRAVRVLPFRISGRQ